MRSDSRPQSHPIAASEGVLAGSLVLKKTILDSAQMHRIVRRMAGEIVENNRGVEDLALVGILTRGFPLAQWLAREIEAQEGAKVLIGSLDITLYRDDLSTIAPNPVVKRSQLPFDPAQRTLVLCDDVLYTGRTVRAALDALVDYGRPKAVQLAVLVDRGWRELPVQADYVGKKVPTSASEVIKVAFAETDDGKESVQILDRGE
jgi:pyrimidine operon attenuation protein/uracil phosphoribosyltransferase